MNGSTKRLAWPCAAAIIVLNSGTAFAQDKDQPDSVVTSGSEIVVTAQRKEERLRDVPLSITALSGETLAQSGIVSTQDLVKVTPGYMLYMNGGFAQPVIRGVSSGSSSPGDNSNIAIYVDGVYQAAQIGQLFDLPDVERVEVLKGPQGTLFGRNAAGGAVRVITRDPSLTDTEGMVSASYGSHNQVMLKGFVTTPLSSTLAVSLSGLYGHNDGWNKDVVTGKRTGSVRSELIRGKLLFEPTPDLKIVAAGFYQKRNDHSVFTGNAGPQAVTIGYQPLPSLPVNTGLFEPYKPYQVALNGPVGVIIESYGGSLNASYETGAGTISAITAYNAGKGTQHSDADYSPVPVLFYNEITKNHSFSQELNFASRQFGPLSFTAGAFYFTSREGYDPLRIQSDANSAPFATLYGTLKTKAEAVFGEGYLDVTDQIQLIAGVRYSHERKRSYASFIGDQDNQGLQGEASFESVTPRFSIKFHPNASTNLYYTYSKGFKSGGFDPLTSGSVPVEPEKNEQHEVGIKARVASGFDVSLAAFHTKYNNIQVQTLIRCPPMGDPAYDPACIETAILENAAKATIYGAEASFTWAVTPGFTLSGGGTYLHGRYDDYQDGTITTATPVVDGMGNPVLGANGLPILLPGTSAADLSGNTPYRTPKFSGNLMANWSQKYDFGEIGANVNLYYTSSWFVDAYNSVKQDAYATLDAQVSFQPANSNLRLTLWGKNLTDKAYAQSYLVAGNAFGVSYAESRAIGVRAEYQF
jgi:iron complex outermembrane receptor protein